jgi:acyl-CoA synthetase (NDP forming)
MSRLEPLAGDIAPAPAGLRSVYRPRSVALIGASERPGSLPAQALANLLESGFEGPIYPVNPRYATVAGLPCHESIAAVPGPVELALVLVPAARTADVVAECAHAGVGAAVLFAAGFAETGPAGRRAEAELAGLARAHGMRLLGPNCQGIVYQPHRLVATFSAALSSGLGAPSGVAYIGQSGALGGSFLSLARERAIGMTAWFSLGNQVDVTVSEMAAELLEDDAIRVLGLHLESLPAGDAWTVVTRRAAELGKWIVVLRSGTSDAGRRAAASHTGAMVAPDAAFHLIAARDGVISVGDVDDMVHAVAQALVGKRRPGPGVGVLTSSGGAGAMAADRLTRAGLAVPELSARTRERLATVIPPYGSTGNPVDVTAQLFAKGDGAFGQACEILAGDPSVDAVAVVLTNVVGDVAERVARSVVDAAARTPKPVEVAWLSSDDSIAAARETLETAGLLVHRSVKGPIDALARVGAVPPAPPERDAVPNAGLADALPAGERTLTEWEGAVLLDRLGITRPRQRLVQSEIQAEDAVRALGGRAVLKIQSRDIGHKSDVGGVRLGVEAGDARVAYRELLAEVGHAAPAAAIVGVLTQEQMAPGLELIIGIEGAADGYPPVMTVGLGGVVTELFSDVASALAPLTPASASALLRRLRIWPLLEGHRGRRPLDAGAVAGVLVACSELAVELGEQLGELEINPLIVYERGVCAVDLLVQLA